MMKIKFMQTYEKPMLSTCHKYCNLRNTTLDNLQCCRDCSIQHWPRHFVAEWLSCKFLWEFHKLLSKVSDKGDHRFVSIGPPL